MVSVHSGGALVHYRCKCVLSFLCLPGFKGLAKTTLKELILIHVLLPAEEGFEESICISFEPFLRSWVHRRDEVHPIGNLAPEERLIYVPSGLGVKLWITEYPVCM